MLIYLFQVTVCLACFYGFYVAALRSETLFHTNRMYLMITLIISLVLPFVKIYIDAQHASSNMLAASTVYLGNYVNNFSASISETEAKSIPWLKILTGVYLLGVAVMAIRLLLAFKQILDIRKTGIHTKVSGHLCILSENVKSPFSFFNTIYLPNQHSFSEMEYNEVIAHEMAHVSGMHTWDVILMELLCIKLWPSPMIYLYRKSLKEVHEFVADAAVLKDTPWEKYAQLLVSQQHSQLQNILSNQLIYSQLKKRLLMMNKEPSGFAARYKYLGIIPLFLIALILFSFRAKIADGPFLQEEKLFFRTDSLPETTVTSLRLTDPVQQPVIPEDYTKLDYTLGMPIFPGCDDVAISERGNCGMYKLGEYINAHMVYPESLKKSGKEGRVLVKFVVDADGLVKDVEIQQSLDPDADQEVLKLVNGMNAAVGKWRPARKEGKSYDAEMVLPVTFSLGTSTAPAEPLKEVDKMARFPGCEEMTSLEERNACAQEKMFHFVYSNVKYPKEDRENNIEGTGIVQFVIGGDGRITDIEVLRSPSQGIKLELERLINAMAALPDRWVPALKDGKPVAFQLILPVKFKLQDEQKEKVEAPASSPEPSEMSSISVMNPIKVTPNPASSEITVDIFAGAQTLWIINSSGVHMHAMKLAKGIEKQLVDVSGLQPGQYVVQVNSETQTLSSSFVKI